MEFKIIDIKGKNKEKINMFNYFVNEKVNTALIHEAVVNFLTNQRRGVANTKTRSEVSGGGKKPWKQKGTGRARAGSSSSPIWRHGGIVFGPKPRDYSYKLPKRKKSLALLNTLMAYNLKEEILILEKLPSEWIKTKQYAGWIQSMDWLDKKVLLVTNGFNQKAFLATRNLRHVKITDASKINTYDVVVSDLVVFEKAAVETLNSRLEMN
ncbi:50S ribosomal protein L4 [bacterium]